MIAHDEAARIAEAMLAFRSERSLHLPKDMFGEPAWDFLLELFVADAVGKRLTGRQIAVRLDIRDAIASRWLKYLSSIGMVVGDGTGDLDDPLTLSAEGIARIEATVERAREMQERIAAAYQPTPRS